MSESMPGPVAGESSSSATPGGTFPSHPKPDKFPPRLVRVRVRFIWLFGLIHLLIAAYASLYAWSRIDKGLFELQGLANVRAIKMYANPHLWARSKAIWALMYFLVGSISLGIGALGLVTGAGLLGLRRWARWCSLAQGTLIVSGGLLHWLRNLDYPAWGPEIPWIVGGLFLVAISSLLWSGPNEAAFATRRTHPPVYVSSALG
jgi:hypothetical protein